MATGRETLVPAALTYLNHRPVGVAPTNLQMYGGIAAGEGVEHAERSALEELIERDALTIWWMSGAPATEIDVGGDGRTSTWVAEIEDAGLRCRLLWLRSSFEVPVVCAFLQDIGRALVACGAACRSHPREAIHKALVEAVDGLLVATELLDPGAALWRMTGTASRYAHPYRPHRPDRAYRQDFRTDFHDVTDLATHTQLYLDPAAQGSVLPWFVAASDRVPLHEIPSLPADGLRDAYVAILGAQDVPTVSVDLTTPDVRAVGLHVARVVAPGLASYAPAAFPLLGSRRLYEVPAALGWRAGPLTEHDLVADPLPYS